MSDEVTEVPLPLNRLPLETRAELSEKRKARRAFEVVFSPFVKAMQECMAAYHAARAQGVEREDALKGLELTLREAWPKQTTKFGPKCDTCDDIGYEVMICRQYARCEREKCMKKGEDWQHRYVISCLCPAGDRMRARQHSEDAMASVGKAKPKRGGWSKV